LRLQLCDTNTRTHDYISETDGDSLSLMGGTKNLFFYSRAALKCNFYMKILVRLLMNSFSCGPNLNLSFQWRTASSTATHNMNLVLTEA